MFFDGFLRTIGGPRAGQRPLTCPSLCREACFFQLNGSLASVGSLALCKHGHHHGKVISGTFPMDQNTHQSRNMFLLCDL
jgi:hypothetical protein